MNKTLKLILIYALIGGAIYWLIWYGMKNGWFTKQTTVTPDNGQTQRQVSYCDVNDNGDIINCTPNVPPGHQCFGIRNDKGQCIGIANNPRGASSY